MKNAYREFVKLRLKFFREQHNLQPRQVADAIHINPKTYSAHEEGRSMPDPFRLRDICNLYKITVDQFLEGFKQTPC